MSWLKVRVIEPKLPNRLNQSPSSDQMNQADEFFGVSWNPSNGFHCLTLSGSQPNLRSNSTMSYWSVTIICIYNAGLTVGVRCMNETLETCEFEKICRVAEERQKLGTLQRNRHYLRLLWAPPTSLEQYPWLPLCCKLPTCWPSAGSERKKANVVVWFIIQSSRILLVTLNYM